MPYPAKTDMIAVHEAAGVVTHVVYVKGTILGNPPLVVLYLSFRNNHALAVTVTGGPAPLGTLGSQAKRHAWINTIEERGATAYVYDAVGGQQLMEHARRLNETEHPVTRVLTCNSCGEFRRCPAHKYHTTGSRPRCREPDTHRCILTAGTLTKMPERGWSDTPRCCRSRCRRFAERAN